MKKISISLCSLLLYILVIFGCRREKFVPKEDGLNLSNLVQEYIVNSSKPRDGTLLLQNQDAAWVKNEVPNIIISGSSYINRDFQTTTSSKRFLINNVQIPVDDKGHSAVSFMQSFGNTPDKIAWLKNLWGTNIKIATMASSQGSINSPAGNNGEDFYVPSPIELQGDLVNNFNLRRNVGNAINWNPDPENPIDSVVICVLYEGTLSQEVYANFPGDNTMRVFLQVPDNGSYTISPELLNMLPVGGKATVAIGRANYKTIVDPNTGEEYLIQAVTYSTSGPIAVSF